MKMDRNFISTNINYCGVFTQNKYSEPSNIVRVRFLENSTIVKTAIVETKGQWEEGGSVPGLRENVEED